DGAAGRPVPDAERSFAARVRGTLRALIDVLSPYHEFAAKYFKHAAEPTNPLSPFSRESSAPRDASIGLYREVIEGSELRIDPGLRARLPELLWLYSLGIVLYWVHDTSPGGERPHQLIDRAVPLADRLLRMSRPPVLPPPLPDVLSIVDDMRP